MEKSDERRAELEQQKKNIVQQIDAFGSEASQDLQNERRHVMDIDEAFKAQRRLIRNIKLVVTAIFAVFAIGLWYTGHYFFSILTIVVMLFFEYNCGLSFREYCANGRKALENDVERQLDNL